jgi:hypothetical protein
VFSQQESGIRPEPLFGGVPDRLGLLPEGVQVSQKFNRTFATGGKSSFNIFVAKAFISSSPHTNNAYFKSFYMCTTALLCFPKNLISWRALTIFVYLKSPLRANLCFYKCLVSVYKDFL